MFTGGTTVKIGCVVANQLSTHISEHGLFVQFNIANSNYIVPPSVDSVDTCSIWSRSHSNPIWFPFVLRANRVSMCRFISLLCSRVMFATQRQSFNVCVNSKLSTSIDTYATSYLTDFARYGRGVHSPSGSVTWGQETHHSPHILSSRRHHTTYVKLTTHSVSVTLSSDGTVLNFIMISTITLKLRCEKLQLWQLSQSNNSMTHLNTWLTVTVTLTTRWWLQRRRWRLKTNLTLISCYLN